MGSSLWRPWTSLIALGVLAGTAKAEIKIDNIQAGDVVRYPVVILHGHATGENIAVGRDWASANKFSVTQGEFKALVELKPGVNMLVMQSGRDTMKYRVDYKPPTNGKKVLAVWIKASDEGDGYITAKPGDPLKIKEKMDIGLKLIQSFYAEAMHEAGYDRKTFGLELDADGHVIVHTVTVPKTGAEMRGMENNASWGFIYDQLKAQFPEAETHWCAMLGYSGYDPATKKSPGHYALGGGSLGAFGSASMVFWPASLKEVPKVFKDATPVDTAQFLDDSNSRDTVWANVATGLGAMAHEMGHTFGLPHSADPYCVMSRGFDYFNRVFCEVESPSAREPATKMAKPDEHTRWDAFMAARLNFNPYFQPDPPEPAKGASPTIKKDGDVITVSAEAGIRVWGTERDDTPAQFTEFRTTVGPKTLTLSEKDLIAKLGGDKPYRLTVIDDRGEQTVIDVNH